MNNVLDLNKNSLLLMKLKTLISSISDDKKNEILHFIAKEINRQSEYILSENQKDLDKFEDKDHPSFDRLRLTKDSINVISNDILNVSNIKSNLGKIIDEYQTKSGLLIKKKNVPMGTIAVIYESRPNVTVDVFSLCFKSGSVCVLKGGKEAIHSNSCFVKIIRECLKKFSLPEELIIKMDEDRENVQLLIKSPNIDLCIPRGGRGLIDFVRNNATIPVIETGAGVVHSYIDEHADEKKALETVVNAKTRRVSVCNALDAILFHSSRLDLLEKIAKKLREKNVTLRCDNVAYDLLRTKIEGVEKADESDIGAEYLSLKVFLKVVNNIDEAIEFININKSMHSESIITENQTNADKFISEVDAAVVFHNTSTAFTDGSQFELGAEIGISTQKLHARGPMAVNELLTYKWIVSSEGMTRK